MSVLRSEFSHDDGTQNGGRPLFAKEGGVAADVLLMVSETTVRRVVILLVVMAAGACQGDSGSQGATTASISATSTSTPTDVDSPVSSHLEVTAVKVLTTEGGRLDWGPDGRIVYDKRTRNSLYDIWMLHPDAPADAVCVTCEATGLPEGHRGNPEWHPSGEWIIFQAAIKVGNPLVTHPGSGVANEIWAIRPDGSDARELFNIDDPNAFDGSLHPHLNNAGDEIVFARYVGFPARFAVNVLSFDADDPRPALPREVIPGVGPEWSEALYETHGYSSDDTKIVFTGFTDATEENNDILIADATTGALVDQVTATPEDWDEHARFQPGTDRLLFSSSRDIPNGAGGVLTGGLDSQADWWVREADGHVHRLTFFSDPEWPLRNATTVDGSAIAITDKKIFAADGEFSQDGSSYAGVLLFRTLRAEEWIVIVDFVEVPGTTTIN